MTRSLCSPRTSVINNIVAKDREAKEDDESWTHYSTDAFTQKSTFKKYLLKRPKKRNLILLRLKF